jgi:hypothetical protein
VPAEVKTPVLSSPDRLNILMKELDHIKAIVGRFDTFFFFMKNICPAGIFAIFSLYITNPFTGLWLIIFIPPIFLLFDVAFRFQYWTSYVERVRVIREALNNGNLSIRLYEITSKSLLRRRLCKSLKLYDFLYYFVLGPCV